MCSRRFWTAPRFARFAETSEIASSSDWIRRLGVAVVEVVAKVATAAARLAKAPPAPKARVPPFCAFDIELSIDTETVWPAFAPTWKAAEAVARRRDDRVVRASWSGR